MKVNVRVRRQDPIGIGKDHGQAVENLFVRLSNNTARKLHALAQNEMKSPLFPAWLMPKVHSHCNNKYWIVSSEGGYSSRVESGVEFLPLRISIRCKQDTSTCRVREVDGEESLNIVYASYNGGSIETNDHVLESTDGTFPSPSLSNTFCQGVGRNGLNNAMGVLLLVLV